MRSVELNHRTGTVQVKKTPLNNAIFTLFLFLSNLPILRFEHLGSWLTLKLGVLTFTIYPRSYFDRKGKKSARELIEDIKYSIHACLLVGPCRLPCSSLARNLMNKCCSSSTCTCCWILLYFLNGELDAG